MAAAARVVVVVRSVVEVATEAASVVKALAAEEVTAVDEGGGRGGAPIATPNTQCLTPCGSCSLRGISTTLLAGELGRALFPALNENLSNFLGETDHDGHSSAPVHLQ